MYWITIFETKRPQGEWKSAGGSRPCPSKPFSGCKKISPFTTGKWLWKYSTHWYSPVHNSLPLFSVQISVRHCNIQYKYIMHMYLFVITVHHFVCSVPWYPSCIRLRLGTAPLYKIPVHNIITVCMYMIFFQYGDTLLHMSALYSTTIQIPVHNILTVCKWFFFNTVHMSALPVYIMHIYYLITICNFVQYGDTPLHTSARYGHAGVIRILVSANCNASEQNKVKENISHICIYRFIIVYPYSVLMYAEEPVGNNETGGTYHQCLFLYPWRYLDE